MARTLTHVEKPHPYDGPAHCLMTGNLSDKLGFLRFKTACDGALGPVHHHIAVSALIAEIEEHPYLGFVKREALEAAEAEVAELTERVAELEQENNELALETGAIDLLESKGYRARKKPGPKKPKETP